jgi:hypothetical protein
LYYFLDESTTSVVFSDKRYDVLGQNQQTTFFLCHIMQHDVRPIGLRRPTSVIATAAINGIHPPSQTSIRQ